MKKVIFTLFCLSLTTVAVKAQDQKAPNNAAAPQAPAVDPNAGVLKFKDKDNTHDYGEVPEGPTAEYDFEFTNTGKKPIIISDAKGSCGCTVPKWPHEPIAPKAKAMIHVTYNTDHRPGPISKEVTITSDAMEKSVVLHIRGTVKPKPQEAPKQEPTMAPVAPAPMPAPKH